MTEKETRTINGKEFVLYRDVETGLYRFSEDAVDVLLEALEKQIAKKPIDKLMYLECPACGYVGILDCGYCSCCGQKLDWND